MRPLLVVLNPREIPEAVESIRALAVDQLWASYMTESQAAAAINQAVSEHPEYDRIGIIADDCVVTQAALDCVLDDSRTLEAVTGWCRLDQTHPLANVTKTPSELAYPGVDSYGTWWTARELLDCAGPQRTYFMGFALTFLSRELWDEYPMRPMAPDGKGFASDFSLSYRLQMAEVDCWVTPAGEVTHLKERWGWDWTPDKDPRKRLLIGERDACVRLFREER